MYANEGGTQQWATISVVAVACSRLTSAARRCKYATDIHTYVLMLHINTCKYTPLLYIFFLLLNAMQEMQK